MKAKLFAGTIFALFLISVVSALTLTASTPSTLTYSSNTSSFTITSDAQMSVTTGFSHTLIIKDSNNNPATFIITPTSSLTGVTSVTFDITTSSINPNFNFGEYSDTLTINAISSIDSTTASVNVPVSFTQDFCQYGNVGGDLRTTVDFVDVKGFGEDNEWYLFDEVSVDIEVKNRGSDDIDNIVVRWGLYDKQNGELIIDEEENDFDLRDGDSKTLNVKFTIDPDDFPSDFNEGDFEFFVKAYSDDLGEDVQCNSVKEDSVKIMRDKDFVILKDIKESNALQCGENAEIRATVWNIGDNTEDNTYFTVTNVKLGINQKINIGDLDPLEDKKVTFNFDVPKGLTIGNYILEFKVYNEDDELFENDNNDLAVFIKELALNDLCVPERASEISATLDSESAVAGKEMVITATVKNIGSVKTDYQILLNNYESWAELKLLSPETLSLNPGESGQVTIKLVPDKTVEGNREFIIQAVADGNVEEQAISVPVSAYKGFFSGFTGFSIGNNLKGNWFIWAIVIVNVLLILMIVVIAVKIARKRVE